MKDKKRFSIFIILGFVIFVGVCNITRCIREIVEIYKMNITLLPNNYVQNILKEHYTYTSFFQFKNPINVFGWVVLGWYVLSYFIGSLGLFKINEKYEQTEEYGSHGTSRWQTQAEIKDDYYNGDIGWFLGSLKAKQDYKVGYKGACHTVDNKSKLNMQIVVVGPPGANKTTGFVLPNIFHLVNSYKKRNLKIRDFKEKKKQINEKNLISVKKLKIKFEDVIKKVTIEKPEVEDLNIFEKVKANFKYNIKVIKGKIIDKFIIGEAIEEEMPDLLITDPKPELYPLTAEFLEKNDYDIYVLDYIDLLYGDCLNAIEYIDSEESLMKVAKGYIDSVSGASEGNASGDMKFWNDQESQVLAALIGFVLQRYPREKQNFTEIAKILVSDDVSDIDSARFFFKENNVTGAAEQLWNNFLMLADSERTRANILGGLAEKLRLFSIPGVQNISSRSTIDISKLGAKKEKPMAIFILMPDDHDTYAPIINVNITVIFSQLYKTARLTNTRLPNPVYIIFEEMANIGKIPNIKKMLGSMRGRRIYPMLIWQSLSQMKERYGDRAFEDMMSNCDNTVYLGINDPFTAEYCSKELGNTTIKTQGLSQNADDGLFSITKITESQNYQNRRLCFPEECKKLENSKIFLVQRTKYPVILYKVQYKYWEYKICKLKEVGSLKKIRDNYIEILEDSENVINITHENIRDRDIELNHEKLGKDDIRKLNAKEIIKDSEVIEDKYISTELPFKGAELNKDMIEQFNNINFDIDK